MRAGTRLALAVWTAALASCSSPPPAGNGAGADVPAGERASGTAWRKPIVVTAERTGYPPGMAHMARFTGAFRIVDGCVMFGGPEGWYLPVFNPAAPPKPTPEGLVWGPRTLRWGERYMIGGGGEPDSLQVNEEARRSCRGQFIRASFFAGEMPR
jgi:hypothetical protein